jgi:hypothetical protein
MRAVGLGGADLAELSAEVLSQGGSLYLRAHAHGSCMAPLIQDGDTLTIQSTEAAILRVGDVALYRDAGNRLFAHRVVGRRLEGDRLRWVTRGDAATGSGYVVEAEQVLGRVVRVQRRGRTLDLDRGTWRLVARLWVATAPVGSWLVGGVARVKRLAAQLLGRAASDL